MNKGLCLIKLQPLNSPLKKGAMGGFALARVGKGPPTPLYKGGNMIYGQALNFWETSFHYSFRTQKGEKP